MIFSLSDSSLYWYYIIIIILSDLRCINAPAHPYGTDAVMYTACFGKLLMDGQTDKRTNRRMD